MVTVFRKGMLSMDYKELSFIWNVHPIFLTGNYYDNLKMNNGYYYSGLWRMIPTTNINVLINIVHHLKDKTINVYTRIKKEYCNNH